LSKNYTEALPEATTRVLQQCKERRKIILSCTMWFGQHVEVFIVKASFVKVKTAEA